MITQDMVAQRDLEIGRQIQASFLPKSLPRPAGWEIAAYFKAAHQVAGDFYDAFPLSGGKRFGLVVGDVCDKGVGAALFMALFRSLIHAFAEQHYSLSWMDLIDKGSDVENHTNAVSHRRKILTTGNAALKNAIDLTNTYISRNHGDTNMFATIFFGILDPANGSLMYINAGHVPALVIGAKGIKTRLEPTGPAVGLLPDMDFSIEQLTLDPGDNLLIYTDGVTDALDPYGRFFGEDKLISLTSQAGNTAQKLLDQIQNSLDEHIAGEQQYDDITLLAARRHTSR